MTAKQFLVGFNQCRRRLLLGMFLALAAVCITSARADDRGYVLTQRGENFGDQYVYISPSGALFKNPRVGAVFMTHGPDWNVTVYNEKTRVYHQTTMQRYRAEQVSRGLTADLQGWSWNPVSAREKICGLSCTEYKMSGFNTIHRNKDDSVSIRDGSYWVANDITVPPALGQILDAMYGLPPTERFPLRLTVVDHGTTRTLIDTYRIEATAIPTRFFTLPAGLTPVVSYKEVYMVDHHIIDEQEANRANSRNTTSGTIDVGGVKLNKAKVQRIIKVLKNGK